MTFVEFSSWTQAMGDSRFEGKRRLMTWDVVS